MKRRRRPTKLTYGILIGLIFLLVGFIIKSPNDDTSEVNLKKNGSLIEHTRYEGIDLISDIKEEDKYYFVIHYPKFESKKLSNEIEEYATSVKKKFLKTVKENEEYIKNHKSSLFLTTELYTSFGDGIYSIVFSEGSYVAGANGEQRGKVYLVDVNKEKFIQQSEIIKDTEENRRKLYDILKGEFMNSPEYKPLFFDDFLKEWVSDEKNKFSNMYVTDKSLVFMFNKYEVTAGAAGMPKISIPFDKARNLLTDEWKEKLTDKFTKNDEDTNNYSDKPNKNESEPKHNSSIGKKVALTFDDGPHPENTIKIIDLLDKYEAKATFFMLGNRVNFYPKIAAKVAEHGHELGNHTWNHKDLTKLSKDEGLKEYERTRQSIEEATGKSPTVVRPPYGAINEEVQNALSKPSILWTIDTLDWKSQDPDEITRIVKENVQDGSIILMHDIQSSTVQAIEPILQFLKEEGYEFVTVSELNTEY